MADKISITVDGRVCRVAKDTFVAAALLNNGVTSFRTSVVGDARGPLCGMGICFECRVKVNGVGHIRSCMMPCEEGMVIETGD